MSALELHPLCTLFPRLDGAEFDALKADIIANGQREPITVYEGQVLDGGNRYRACVEAGIEPKLRNFDGCNPASFVFSANFHRRHLTAGQQAVIVAQAQNWANAQQVGRPEKSGSTAELKTVADRVAESGASDRAQRMADQLARQAPELAKKVAEGKLSLPKAHAQLASKAAPQLPQVAAAEPIAPAGSCDDAPDLGITSSAPQPSASFDRFMESLDDGHMPDLEEINRALEAKNAALEEEVAKLKAEITRLGGTDQAARIEALCLERDEAYGLASSHHSSFLKANERVVDYEKLLARLRRAAGVEKDSEIRDCILLLKGAA